MSNGEERTAPAAPEGRPLYVMFTEVPGRYDLVNKAITWGLDKRWRMEAARECLADGPRRLLDLCCGTGDLALTVAGLGGKGLHVTGFDFSQPMLDIAMQKAGEHRLGISWVRGDAAQMPFPDAHFDCVGISFGFRNLIYKNPNAERHLAEVFRVLRPSGRFVIVESSQPDSLVVRRCFHLYLRGFVAGIGSAVSGKRAAYQYLAHSAMRFDTRGEVESRLRGVGFREATSRPRLFGAVGITVAVK